MTNLKTLKEITRFSREGHGEEKKWWLKCVNVDELRQEAIKWVKQHRKITPRWAKETNEEFFMAFFNITEEDLK